VKSSNVEFDTVTGQDFWISWPRAGSRTKKICVGSRFDSTCGGFSPAQTGSM